MSWNKDAATMFVGITLCLSVLILPISVSAIVYSQKNVGSPCVGTYRGITFTYPYWLLIYGIGDIVAIPFIAIYTMSRFPDWHRKEWAILVSVFNNYLLALFQMYRFAWFVVGAILLFNTVDKNCQYADGKSLYSLGLAVFILQLISLFCSSAANKKQNTSGNNRTSSIV